MRKKKVGERGSIEVVVLVIVFALVIGLIVWRYVEADKAQTDAEQAIANESITDVIPTKEKVKIPELSVMFEVSQSAGEITYEMQDDTAASLRATELLEAEFTCDGDNVGEFATLQQGVDESDEGTAYTANVNGERYAVELPNETCYAEDMMDTYQEVAAEAADSLRKLEND